MHFNDIYLPLHHTTSTQISISENSLNVGKNLASPHNHISNTPLPEPSQEEEPTFSSILEPPQAKETIATTAPSLAPTATPIHPMTTRSMDGSRKAKSLLDYKVYTTT